MLDEARKSDPAVRPLLQPPPQGALGDEFAPGAAAEAEDERVTLANLSEEKTRLKVSELRLEPSPSPTPTPSPSPHPHPSPNPNPNRNPDPNQVSELRLKRRAAALELSELREREATKEARDLALSEP